MARFQQLLQRRPFHDSRLELTMFDGLKGGAVPMTVRHEAPGLFSAVVPRIRYGTSRQIAWHLGDEGAGVARGSRDEASRTAGNRDRDDGLTTPFGFVCSFSPEFQTLGVGQATRDQIQKDGMGDVSRVGCAGLNLPNAQSARLVRLWPAPLALALLLVPVDILVRRMG